MIIYYKKNTGKFGVPKWGLRVKKGFKPVFNENGEAILVDAKDPGTKIKLKNGGLPLDYFTLLETRINYKDVDENDQEIDSGKSMVIFRFHSSADFARMSIDQHIKRHGAVHARYFIYDGIDKTEEELIDWALNTKDLVANDGITKIYKAKEVK